MLTHTAGLKHSVEEASNFRIFSPGEKDSNYNAPITQAIASQQPVIYVLVSIMNTLFTYGPSVEYMMQETEKAYGDPLIPIIYVCADTLQNITKEYLFGNKLNDPIGKYRNKWLTQYNTAVATLKAEGIKPNHKILYWDTIKAIPEYQGIKTFTDAILKPELTLESLQHAFPTAPKSVLKNLIQEIQLVRILENIPVISNEFRGRNYTKLQGQAQKEKLAAAAFRKQAERAQIEFIETNKVRQEDLELQQRIQGLNLATYQYLSEEYSTFLLLSYLHIASDIKEKLGIQPSDVRDDSILRPTLSYPISSSKGNLASTTFAQFQSIETLYINYCMDLGLPILREKVTLVDSFVPEKFRPTPKGARLFLSDAVSPAQAHVESSENNSLSTENSEIMSSLPQTEKRKDRAATSPTLTSSSSYKAEYTPQVRRSKSEETLPQSCNSSSPSQNNTSSSITGKQSPPATKASFLTIGAQRDRTTAVNELIDNKPSSVYSSPGSISPTIFQLNDIEKVVKKIIAIIVKHQQTGATARKISYKNGITCEIEVLKKNPVLENESVSLTDMEDLIKDAVVSAKEGCHESISLNYQGYSFSLEVGPTPSQTHSLDSKSDRPSLSST